MISSLHLQNFQSHKDTRIDFSPGVNALVGLSDSGKTAVLRALHWVINNKPTGADFASHWADKEHTSVTLALGNGPIIRRVRTKSTNEYWLNDQCFKAFGQDVPAEIRAALNFADVNIQFQQDGPFLLSSNPGEVAQYLNQVVRLDGIDRSASYVRKLLAAAQQGVRVEEARIADVAGQLEAYDTLGGFEGAVVALETGTKRQQEARAQQSRLQQLEDKIIAQREAVGRYARVAGGSEKVEWLIVKEASLSLRKDRVLGRLRELRGKMVAQQATLARCKPLVLAEGAFKAAEATDARVRGLIAREKALQGFWDRAAGLLKAKVGAEQEYQRLHGQFEELMPDVCPLCEQEIK